MNRTLILGAICALISGSVFAQSSFDKIGIPALKKSVIESFVKTDQGKSCPLGGALSLDHLAELTGSASSAADLMALLIENVSTGRSKLDTDGSRCGKCQQINQVAAYTTSEPSRTVINAACSNRPTINIRKLLPSDQIENFATSVLRGNSPEGRSLYQGCPDPCSFYVASATTDRGANQSMLNLSVHCGQPRKGSILFADYKYTVGLIQSWSCK